MLGGGGDNIEEIHGGGGGGGAEGGCDRGMEFILSILLQQHNELYFLGYYYFTTIFSMAVDYYNIINLINLICTSTKTSI